MFKPTNPKHDTHGVWWCAQRTTVEVSMQRVFEVTVYTEATWSTCSNRNAKYYCTGQNHIGSQNSYETYKLETISRISLAGEFNAQRIRAFNPREATTLDQEQRVFLAQLDGEGAG